MALFGKGGPGAQMKSPGEDGEQRPAALARYSLKITTSLRFCKQKQWISDGWMSLVVTESKENLQPSLFQTC